MQHISVNPPTYASKCSNVQYDHLTHTWPAYLVFLCRFIAFGEGLLLRTIRLGSEVKKITAKLKSKAWIMLLFVWTSRTKAVMHHLRPPYSLRVWFGRCLVQNHKMHHLTVGCTTLPALGVPSTWCQVLSTCYQVPST